VIPAAFLICALSLPVASFHHDPLTVADVKVLHLLSDWKTNRSFNPRYSRNVLMMAAPPIWIFQLLQSGFRPVHLITDGRHTAYDVRASWLDQPIKKDSMQFVIFGGYIGHSHWSQMRLLAEMVYALMPSSYLIFDETMAKEFIFYLVGLGFHPLDLRWHQMTIWRKPSLPKQYKQPYAVIRTSA
jgi:hypothetical protein